MATKAAAQPTGWRQWSVATLWVTTLAGAATAALIRWNMITSVRFVTGVSIGLLIVAAVAGVRISRVDSVLLTIPTALTLARGAALAVFAGFLILGLPEGSLAWVPAVLFGFAAAGDAVDGALARATDSVSDLGAQLDTEMDGLTVLFGTLAVVAAGRVPVVFLIVGIARYAFVFGLWQRARRGLPNYELPPSQLRRLLGGAAMITILLGLLPVVPTDTSRLLATVVLVPFAINFIGDWLSVSGRRRG